MRQYLLTNAQSAGYRTLDLQEVFEQDYLEHRKSFEFKQDRHWNGYAHGVVAKTVLSGVLPKKVLSDRN